MYVVSSSLITRTWESQLRNKLRSFADSSTKSFKDAEESLIEQTKDLDQSLLVKAREDLRQSAARFESLMDNVPVPKHLADVPATLKEYGFHPAKRVAGMDGYKFRVHGRSCPDSGSDRRSKFAVPGSYFP